MSIDDFPNDNPDLMWRVLRADGSADPDRHPGLDAEALLRAYREMRRLRLLDARMVALQRQGRISFYGGSRGQEAVPIAAALTIRPDDWVFPALREHGVMLARGYPLKALIAQVFGNSGDPSKGRQMPCHPSSRSVNQVSWSSCVGTQIPHAVGAAWAMRAKGTGLVAVAFMGDGATSEGDFHAAMNFAGVWKVPCVLVCQNNQWSISVPAERQTASRTLAVKGGAYGIPSIRVDGNDFLAAYGALHRAVERARAGGGPTFVEAVTYRIGPHSTSDDPSRYRSDEQEIEWAQNDPLDRMKLHLASIGVLTPVADAELEGSVLAEINAAIDEVEALPQLPASSFFDDVYAEMPWHLREERAELKKVEQTPTAE
jgi:pyruvate dehydrogenase E1 component alpha subunit/2-oxoisovalerate dehydrogenase E1 component alpha subunit